MRARDAEPWARRVMAAHLRASVDIWDDGSADGLYDLAVRHGEQPIAAAEVVGDIDAVAAETWSLVNGEKRVWTDERIAGGWLVSIEPSARIKRLRKELPLFLRSLESRRAHGELFSDEVEARAAELDIVSWHQSDTCAPGSIYVTFALESEKIGGLVPHDGESVCTWLLDFLSDPGRVDVIDKLDRATQPERHVFVFVSALSTAPWPVPYVLTTDPVLLPRSPALLPPPITQAWIASTWNTGTGILWNGRAWERFNKIP